MERLKVSGKSKKNVVVYLSSYKIVTLTCSAAESYEVNRALSELTAGSYGLTFQSRIKSDIII